MQLSSRLFLFLGSATLVASSGILSIETKVDTPKPKEGTLTTKVISHVFCEACIEMPLNPTLKDSHTYVELKHDPKASLPTSFTICSMVMAPFDGLLQIFNLLGKDGQQFLPAVIYQYASSEGPNMELYFYKNQVSGNIPLVFPHQWVKSCMAVDTGSGLVQWVLDGTLVESKVIGEMINSTNVPTDLTGRLVFGAVEYAAGSWMMISNKVANVNVFSSALDVEEMQKRTQGGECAGEGDYLSWGDMQWTLHGKAVLEIERGEEPCKEKPLVDLYTIPMAGMELCMQFCENVGSRAPSVITLPEWNALRGFFEQAYNDDVLYAKFIWLAIDNKDGEWKDYYTRQKMNFTPPWVNFGSTMDQQCGHQVNEDSWTDVQCKRSDLACACTRQPRAYLREGLQNACHGILLLRGYHLIPP